MPQAPIAPETLSDEQMLAKQQPAAATRPMTFGPNLVVKPADIFGKSIACLGTTGSGKSTTARKIAEEFMASGIAFTVADIEDEYYGLKELGEVILAGPQSHGEAAVDVVVTTSQQMFALAKKAYSEQLSVVLMLNDLDDGTREEFLAAYCQGLFDAGKEVSSRRPHVLIVEEAHEYIPQVGVSRENPLYVAMIRLGKRGRKRGISLLLTSQRPANVSKDILTQCQIFFMHQVVWTTDVNTYKTVLPIADLQEQLESFKKGEVFFVHGKEMVRTRISLPQTKSPSSTPGTTDLPDSSNFQPIANAADLQRYIDIADAGGLILFTPEQLEQVKERVDFLNQERQKLSLKVAEIRGQGLLPDRDVLSELKKWTVRAGQHKAMVHALTTVIALIEQNNQISEGENNTNGRVIAL